MKNYEIYNTDAKNRIYFSIVLIFLLGFSLMYITTVIELKNDVNALRAEHLDIPSTASDMTFLIKSAVCFFISIFMLVGSIGMIARRNWGIQAAAAGLFGQAVMYIAEIAIFGSQTFNYPPARFIVGIIVIDMVIIWKILKEKTD